MGETLCAGFVLMAGLAIVQPPAASPAGAPAGSAPRSAAGSTVRSQRTLAPTAILATAPSPAASGQQPTLVVTPAPADPGPAEAQPAPQPAVPPSVLPPGVRVAEPAPPAKSRYLVQVMEGVLQSAVRYAAAQANTKLQAVSPDLLQLSGAARARGFRLDGYGVFFDVEVPSALRQTMGWTARMMQQNDQTLDQAFVQLRRLMTELDGKRRGDAETALRLVELRARPHMPSMPRQYAPQQGNDRSSITAVKAASTPAPAAGVGDAPTTSATNGAPSGPAAAATAAPAAAPAPTAEDLAWMQNPDGAYEMEVRDALVSAMLGYGSTLALQPEEYLTVAARDNQSVVVPGDLSETVTVILRIKGRDLTDLMAGRLTEQDARRRVEVREF